MAGSAAQAKSKIKKESVDKGYGVRSTRVPCPGSGREIKSTESYSRKYKYGGYDYKYNCKECGGVYAKVRKKDKSKYITYTNGKPKYFLNKHTRKIENAKPFALCAECNAEVFSIDFLCESCRGEDSLE